MYTIYESTSIILDQYVPVACFDDFFDASDWIDEHPEGSFYIDTKDPFVPVLTDEDLDAYVSYHHSSCKDPRDGFSEYELPSVLMFLAYAAQLKAMTLPQSDPGHFGYETMLYQYSNVADNI